MYLNPCGGLEILPVLVVVDLSSDVSIASSSSSATIFVLDPRFCKGCLKFFRWSGFFRKHLSQYLHFGRSPLPTFPGSGRQSVSPSSFFAIFSEVAPSDSYHIKLNSHINNVYHVVHYN